MVLQRQLKLAVHGSRFHWTPNLDASKRVVATWRIRLNKPTTLVGIFTGASIEFPVVDVKMPSGDSVKNSSK